MLKQIDVRGARFGALLTTFVLALTLATESWILALWQTAVFAIGAAFGPARTPYSSIFRAVVKPRLKSSPTFEDERPPRFAQAVGFLFGAVALVGVASGISLLFTLSIAFALVAAFLNAAFNFCLGCKVYLLLVRAFNVNQRSAGKSPASVQ
ncbi:MAG: DUF4395 domain-containing protein [Candidatus Nanopelagicaceae bacterium]